MEMPLLWHIPLSHYNEKVRWALDHKRIVHRRQVLGPNYLFRAWSATRRGTLPILWLDGRAIGDSTRIIAALEARYPEPALYPVDAAARERALALEDYFDEQLGPALRAAVVTPLFRHDPDPRVARPDDRHAQPSVPEAAAARADFPGVLSLSTQDQRREVGSRSRHRERGARPNRARTARARLFGRRCILGGRSHGRGDAFTDTAAAGDPVPAAPRAPGICAGLPCRAAAASGH